MDKILVINTVIAFSALVAGLYSRSLLTALTAGFWMAVVHSGLILLAMGQAGVTTVTEVPVVNEALDALIKSGYADFTQARLVAYFAGSAVGLILLTVAAFFVRWAVTKFLVLLLPEKASA
jgi:hypothetical protein